MRLEIKNNTKWIVYGALVVSVIANIYFITHLSDSKVGDAKTERLVEKGRDTDSQDRTLRTIDSLLISNYYLKALEVYHLQLDSNKQSEEVMQLRDSLVRKLMSERAIQVNTSQERSRTGVVDGSGTVRPEEIRQYDSLQFALVKAKAQVDNMRRQLANKAFGEYLSFKSSKGSDMYYVGQVKNEKANGRGVALLNTGSRYEGEWKDNMRHGEGTFFWPDGQYYVGGYKDDSRHGIGSYFWPNGDKFIGEWANDQRNGEGTFYGKEGEVMARGIWQDDELIEVEKDRN